MNDKAYSKLSADQKRKKQQRDKATRFKFMEEEKVVENYHTTHLPYGRGLVKDVKKK